MARRALPKKSSPARREEEALLSRLDAALSEVELRHVLAGALLALDAAARQRLLARVGPETGAALEPVLIPPRKSAASATPAVAVAGKGKLRQEWDRLWQQWTDVVEATGEEHGKYVRQDADWEPPYLDPYSVSKDLDAIASRMRPLIPRVLVEQIAPEFRFAEALDTLDEDLYAGQPDWMEPGGGEPCCLGPEATSCLLEWEWAVAQRDGSDAQAFADDLGGIEDRLTNVQLHGQTVRNFVRDLAGERRPRAPKARARAQGRRVSR